MKDVTDLNLSNVHDTSSIKNKIVSKLATVFANVTVPNANINIKDPTLRSIVGSFSADQNQIWSKAYTFARDDLIPGAGMVIGGTALAAIIYLFVEKMFIFYLMIKV